MRRLTSQLNRTPGKQPSPRYRPAAKAASVRLVTTIYLSVICLITAGIVVFATGNMTVGGVPMSIIREFLADEKARDAYFAGNKKALHDRLEQMGIEEDIKAYYRPQIPDEAKLDQHIHQILYERTGYVGRSYKVNSQGVLILK